MTKYPMTTLLLTVIVLFFVAVGLARAGEQVDAAVTLERHLDLHSAEIQALTKSFKDLGQRVTDLEDGAAPPVDPPDQSPFVEHRIPGQMQAEDYDLGGEGLAYHDFDLGNTGGAYRADDVDIKAVTGGFVVGWNNDGDWLEYTVIAEAGVYDINFLVAAKIADPGSIRVTLDGEVVGELQVRSTGSWDSYQIQTLHRVVVDAGEQVLHLEMIGNWLDLGSFEFVPEGSTAIEPFWEDDFSGDWTSRWPTKWIGQSLDRTSTLERDGETWLRVSFTEGVVGKGMKFMTNHGPRERLYLQFDVRFAENFDWVLGGKLPGLAGGEVKAGETPTGEDGWSARFMWREDGEGVAYIYHPDMPGKWGEDTNLGNFQFQSGVVQRLEMEIVMNTPEQRDGVIRAWLDDVLVVERTKIRWRDIPSLQIDGITFSTFFGGWKDTWAPTKDEHIDFGNFTLYESRPQP